jgi:conjugative relaxase-like TrwC/TraI family protein
MISSFQLKTTAAVLDYHANAFDAERAREGVAGEQTTATWGGVGADLAGFGMGSVAKEKDLRDVLDGRIGGQEIKAGFSSEQGGQYHKPGMDFTFSPGKSVSLVGLVGNDTRVQAAHKAAVSTAMNFLEKNGAEYRGSNQKDSEVASGNLLYLKVEHETSRGNDPQLHTHVLITNATQDKEGKWRALSNHKLLTLRKQADTVYSQSLERNLNKLGYGTEQGKSGPEILGFNKEQLAAFSSRSAEIKEHLASKGVAIEAATTGQKQVANLASRAPKESLSREELNETWRKTAQSVGIDVTRLSSEREPPDRIEFKPANPDALNQGIERLTEQSYKAASAFEYNKTNFAENGDRKSALEGMQEALSMSQPKTASQYRSQLSSMPGLKFVKTEQVQAQLDKAAESGAFTKNGDKYAPKGLEDESTRKAEFLDAVLSAVVKNIGNRFEQADSAQANYEQVRNTSVEPAEITAAANSYSSAARAAGPLTSKQIAAEMRDVGVKYLKSEDVNQAIGRAVSSGKLMETKGKFSTNIAEGEKHTQNSKNAWAESKQPSEKRLEVAIERLVDRMEDARHDINFFVKEKTEAIKLGDINLVDKLDEGIKNAESKLASTLPNFQEAIRKELGRTAINDNTLLKSEYISKERINQSIAKAIDTGVLKINGDKLSIESFEQTSERIDKNKSLISKAQKETKDLGYSIKKYEKMVAYKDKQLKAKKDYLQKREQALKKLPPSKINRIKNRTSTNISKSIEDIFKVTSQFVRRPVHTTLKFTVRNTSRAVESIGKAVVSQSVQLGKAVLVGVTAATVTQIAALNTVKKNGVRSKSDLAKNITNKLEENNKKLNGKLEIVLTGYREDSKGDIHRAKLTPANVTLAAAATAITATSLHKTTFGLALRNALVTNIKTKQVGAVEAVWGKAMISTSKALTKSIGKRLSKSHQHHNYGKHVIKLKGIQNKQVEAYKDLVKAHIDKDKLPKVEAESSIKLAKERLQALNVQALKVSNRMVSGAKLELGAGRFQSHKVDQVIKMRDNIESAISKFKAYGEISLNEKKAITGKDWRDIQKIEMTAGSTDKLGLHKKWEKEKHLKAATKSKGSNFYSNESTKSSSSQLTR